MLDETPLSKLSYKSSARKLSVVSQHNYYNFDFSVREVVMMGRSPHKRALEQDTAKDRAIVEEALRTVRMTRFFDRSFSILSGGNSSGCFLPVLSRSRRPA